MPESFAELAVVAGVLLAAWLFTHFFTRWAYKRCSSCGALNVHRREKCRVCGHPFGPSAV